MNRLRSGVGTILGVAGLLAVLIAAKPSLARTPSLLLGIGTVYAGVGWYTLRYWSTLRRVGAASRDPMRAGILAGCFAMGMTSLLTYDVAAGILGAGLALFAQTAGTISGHDAMLENG